MWFADAPPPAGTLGTSPNAETRYLAQPNDGRNLWVVSVVPMAWQQAEYADEFAIMPDSLLHAEGYRLSQIAHVQLPAEMGAVLEKGPDALNHETHPLRPTLLSISDRRILAVSRTFGHLNVCITLYRDTWVLVISPDSAKSIALVTSQ